MIRCEAFGGPCDGRTWVLPEQAPIWLRYADTHHLYRPTTVRRHRRVSYRYAGLSRPVGNNREHGVPNLGAGDRLS